MKMSVIKLKNWLLNVFGSRLMSSDSYDQEMYGALETEYQENLVDDEDSVSAADEGEKI